MPEEEVKPDEKETTQDAQLASDNMSSGKEKMPTVDMEADYEASKKMSVSDVDRTGAGAKEAEAATASDFEVPKQEGTKAKAEPTGNPDDYRDMAKDVSSTTKTGADAQ